MLWTILNSRHLGRARWEIHHNKFFIIFFILDLGILNLLHLAGSEVSMERRRCLRSSFTIFGLYSLGSDTLGDHDDENPDFNIYNRIKDHTIRTKKDLFCWRLSAWRFSIACSYSCQLWYPHIFLLFLAVMVMVMVMVMVVVMVVLTTTTTIPWPHPPSPQPPSHPLAFWPPELQNAYSITKDNVP